MFSSTDTLWTATAALAVTAASLTAFGLRQPRYRGWSWWLAAAWLSVAGVAAAATGSGKPWIAAPAALLLVQWPVLTLIGVRRFHARTRLPGGERSDWAMLAVAGGLAASGPLWAADGSLAALVPASAAALVQLYAACLLFCGPADRDSLPLQGLGATIALVALAPLAAAWPGYDLAAPIAPRAVAAVLGTVVMAFVALTLVFERTQRQLRDSQRRLRVLANTDALTNVPNRRHFTELATLALRADAPGSAALMIFDIDHFKRINDRLGHAAGDRALRLVSASMVEHLRAQDVAGRHGGDEFVLLLRQTQVRDAGGVAARIVARLQAQTEFSTLPRLSLSFGMVQVQSGETIVQALNRADQALYQAKREGRSRAVTALGDDDTAAFGESRPLGLSSC